MSKNLKIIICVVFFPITIIVGLILLISKCVQSRRIHSYLYTISVSDIDAISGVQFEEIVAYLFSFFGYKTTLTKRSGDYGVDIFAKFRGTNYCIQTKLYYNHSVGSAAIQEINTAKNYYAMDYAVVVTNSKYSKQAVDMANRLTVILFDRIDFVKLLQNYKSGNKKFLRKYMEEKLCLKR